MFTMLREFWEWYWPEVRGNVLAIVPCGLAAFFWLRSKHLALTAAHKSHDQKLAKLMDKLNPDTEGGIADVLDRLDPTTAGGIRVILEAITKEVA